MKIEDILQKLGDDILTEGTKATIVEAFNSAVETKVESQLAERVEVELIAQDTEYTEELKGLLEALDTDHTVKAQALFEEIQNKHKVELSQMDEKCTKDLKVVIDHYEEQMGEQTKQVMESLVETIDMYLSEVLEESIPTKQLQEMANNRYAQKSLDAIKHIAVVDESFKNKEIREAIENGASQLNQLRKEKDMALEEARKVKVANLLSEKTSSMPKEKASYIINLLEGKDYDFVATNLAYAERMFERNDNKERANARKKTLLVTENVDRPLQTDGDDTKTLNEGATVRSDMDCYIKNLIR